MADDTEKQQQTNVISDLTVPAGDVLRLSATGVNDGVLQDTLMDTSSVNMGATTVQYLDENGETHELSISPEALSNLVNSANTNTGANIGEDAGGNTIMFNNENYTIVGSYVNEMGEAGADNDQIQLVLPTNLEQESSRLMVDSQMVSASSERIFLPTVDAMQDPIITQNGQLDSELIHGTPLQPQVRESLISSQLMAPSMVNAINAVEKPVNLHETSMPSTSKTVRFSDQAAESDETKKAPLGSSENPIRIIQQGNQYTPVQQLTPEQLQQIMQVVQNQQMMKSSTPDQPSDSGASVMFNPETNTRIIYRVIYPNEIHNKPPKMPPHKPQGRKRVLVEEEPEDEATREEKDRRKKVRPRTRSGRVSKPPRHMLDDYKHIHTLDWDQDYDDSDGGYSELKFSQEEASFEPVIYPLKPKNSVCAACGRAYISEPNLRRHYLRFPDHVNADTYVADKGKGEDSNDDENEDLAEISPDKPPDIEDESSNDNVVTKTTTVADKDDIKKAITAKVNDITKTTSVGAPDVPDDSINDDSIESMDISDSVPSTKHDENNTKKSEILGDKENTDDTNKVTEVVDTNAEENSESNKQKPEHDKKFEGNADKDDENIDSYEPKPITETSEKMLENCDNESDKISTTSSEFLTEHQNNPDESFARDDTPSPNEFELPTPIKRARGRPGRPRGRSRGRRRCYVGSYFDANDYIERPRKRRVVLRQLVDACTDDDLETASLPRLSQSVSLWEFLLHKLSLPDTNKPNSSVIDVRDVYKELKTLHAHVQKLTTETVAKATAEDVTSGNVKNFMVEDNLLWKSLGLDVGIYTVKCLTERAHLLTTFKTELPDDPTIKPSTCTQAQVKSDPMTKMCQDMSKNLVYNYPISSSKTLPANIVFSTNNPVPISSLPPHIKLTNGTLKTGMILPSNVASSVTQTPVFANSKIVPLSGITYVPGYKSPSQFVISTSGSINSNNPVQYVQSKPFTNNSFTTNLNNTGSRPSNSYVPVLVNNPVLNSSSLPYKTNSTTVNPQTIQTHDGTGVKSFYEQPNDSGVFAISKGSTANMTLNSVLNEVGINSGEQQTLTNKRVTQMDVGATPVQIITNTAYSASMAYSANTAYNTNNSFNSINQNTQVANTNSQDGVESVDNPMKLQPVLYQSSDNAESQIMHDNSTQIVLDNSSHVVTNSDGSLIRIVNEDASNSATDNSVHMVTDDTSTMTDNISFRSNNTTQLTARAPQLSGESQLMDTSQFSATTPQLGSVTSQFGNTSQLGSVISTFGNTTPQMSTATSQLASSTSQLGSSTSQLGSTTSHVSSSTPQASSTTSTQSVEEILGGSTIYQTEEGNLLIQRPDGVTLQLQGDKDISLETLQSLLKLVP